MKTTFQTLKPMLLIAAILVGLVVQNARSNAGETRTAFSAGECFLCAEAHI